MGLVLLIFSLLHDHFFIVSVLSFGQSHFAALFLYHFGIKSLGKSSLPVLERAFKSQGCMKNHAKQLMRAPIRGTQCVMYINPEGFFFFLME